MSHFKSIFAVLILVMLMPACKVGKDAAKQAGNSTTANAIKRIPGFNEKFFDASRAKIAGDLETSVKLFQECLKMNPKEPVLYYEIGLLYAWQNKELPKAFDMADKAVRLDPKNQWYWMLYAELAVKNRKFEEAAKAYEKINEISPNSLEIYYEWANALIYARKYNDAIKVYDKMEEKVGVNEEISMQKEKIYYSLGQMESALKEMQKLSETFPTNVKYMEMLSELYIVTGKQENAMEVYDQIRKIEPDNATVHLALADLYKQQNNREKALEEVKIAFSSPNLDIDNKMKILLQYYQISEKEVSYRDDAYQLIDIMIKTHPDDAKSYTIHGDYLLRDNRNDEAQEEFEKAIKLDPSKYPIWEQLLFLYASTSNYTSMIEKSKAAIEYFPTQPLPYLFNGMANLQMKNTETSIQSLNTGKDIVVGNDKLKAEFFSYLAEAYHQANNNVLSDEYFDKYLKIEPNNNYVLNNYSYYLAVRGEKLDQAKDMSEKTVKTDSKNPSFLDTYGWVLYKLGKYSDAKIMIERAIENSAQYSTDIMEHYGDVLYKLGESVKALESWQKAKALGEGSNFLDEKIKTGKLIE